MIRTKRMKALELVYDRPIADILLEALNRHEDINGAALALGLSYQTTYLYIQRCRLVRRWAKEGER